MFFFLDSYLSTREAGRGCLFVPARIFPLFPLFPLVLYNRGGGVQRDIYYSVHILRKFEATKLFPVISSCRKTVAEFFSSIRHATALSLPFLPSFVFLSLLPSPLFFPPAESCFRMSLFKNPLPASSFPFPKVDVELGRCDENIPIKKTKKQKRKALLRAGQLLSARLLRFPSFLCCPFSPPKNGSTST